jgi:hypothetical protein
MSINLCTVGKEDMLNYLTAQYANWTVCLFTNNHTPVDGDVLTTYTEATFSGYAEVTCPSFGAAYNNSLSQAEADGSSTATFICNGGGTTNSIYGYYVKQGTTLLWAELFAGAPISMANNGDRIGVYLSLTLNHP